LAGCGGSEPGWQAEYREQTRRDYNDPERVDPIVLLQICNVFDEDGGRELLEQEILASWAEDVYEGYDGSGRPLAEILADFGLVENPATIDEAAQIVIEEMEGACP